MDEMVTYATPMDVLRQVLHLHENDSRDITTVRVESAIEAIKQYHKQFVGEMIQPDALTLEEKILEAKDYGIRFMKVKLNECYVDTHDAILVSPNITTESFEKIIDGKLKYYRDRDFMKILEKHELIKS